jgi:hypothetical protein
MMQTAECPQRENLGVYILGALELEERRQFEAHLADCESCRDELGPLSGLPGLLNTVDPAEAFALLEDKALGAAAFLDEDLLGATALLNGHGPGTPADDGSSEPPADLLATVHDITSARRRRRTWQSAGLTAAAALLIVVGAAAGSAVGHRAQPSQAAGQTDGQTYGQAVGGWKTISSASQDPGAVVMYRQMGWGTQLQAKVTGLPPGVHCQMTVLTADGTAVVAGSWDTDAKAGTVVYPSSADVSASKIREIVITDGNRSPITITT